MNGITMRYRTLFISIPLLCGIALGTFAWDKIVLPFKNPLGIVGTLSIIRYNPANDVLRFLVYITVPIFFLILLYIFLYKKVPSLFASTHLKESLPENASGRKVCLCIFLLIMLSVFFAIITPTFHANMRYTDTFHEGECLGTAVSYAAGKVPYKDFIFLHGVYYEPLRPLLAFKLFGKSIGAHRTSLSLHQILAFVALGIMLLIIFKRNFLYAFAAIIVIGIACNKNRLLNIPHFFIIPQRDVLTFSYISIVCAMPSLRKNIWALCLGSFLFGFLPFGAFIYSLDRAFYLTASFCITAPIFFLFLIKQRTARTVSAVSALAGISTAFFLLFILLRGGIKDFFLFNFIQLPQYKELMDGFVYPISNILFYVPCLIIAMNTYWIALQFLREFHAHRRHFKDACASFFEKYLAEFSLALMGVFFFRTALGRSDIEHVAASFPLSCFLSGVIVSKYFFPALCEKFRSMNTAILYGLYSIITYGVIWCAYMFCRYPIILPDSFPAAQSDSAFIPENYKRTITFLQENLKENDSFYTLTSEAAWYYFLDRPSPSRFPVLWYAATEDFQRAVVADLKQCNTRMILYSSNHWANHIDRISSKKRHPIVFNYIHTHYRFYKQIDDHELWIKRSE